MITDKEAIFLAEYMYEFEASTRYDSDFVLDSDIYSRGCNYSIA